MKRPSQSIVCVAVVCLQVLSIARERQAEEEARPETEAGVAEEAPYAESVRLLDAWLEAQVAYDRLPSLTVGIVVDQQLLWSRGYGIADTERKVPAEPGTIYSICSISKLFTSIAVLQLRDAGRLQLDDRLDKHLPWFRLERPDKDGAPITIRSVLTHSAGLPREAAFPYWTGPEFPFPEGRQIREALGEQKALYPAAKYFQYSNLGLTLLGELVAEVSETPFDDYVEERILRPLQLEDTRPHLPASLWRGKLATGYSALRRDGTREMLKLFDARGIAAAAGFSSTVNDLARFASWQFRVLDGGKSDILKGSTLREMHRVQWMDPNWKNSWGLGFSIREVNGRSLVGHGGGCPGYRTQLTLDPKNKLAFVVMINANGSTPDKYVTGVRRVLEKSKEKKTLDENKRTQVDLESYAGIYDLQPWWGELVAVPWKGQLALVALPTREPWNHWTLLRHVEGDTFRRVRDDETLGEEVVFERDSNGEVLRMQRHNNFDAFVRKLGQSPKAPRASRR